MEPARNPLRQTLIDLPISGCAKVIVRRGRHSLDRLEIADLNADGARDD